MMEGAIVEAGKRACIATPLNNSMVWLVNAMKESYLGRSAELRIHAGQSVTRIRFLGVAAYEIVTRSGQHILVDPFLDENPGSPIEAPRISSCGSGRRVPRRLRSPRRYRQYRRPPRLRCTD
jgi:hypothetical protein